MSTSIRHQFNIILFVYSNSLVPLVHACALDSPFSTGESRSFDVLVANTTSAYNYAYLEMYAPWDDIFVVSIVSPSGFPFTVLTNSSNCLSNTDGVEITVCAGKQIT